MRYQFDPKNSVTLAALALSCGGALGDNLDSVASGGTISGGAPTFPTSPSTNAPSTYPIGGRTSGAASTASFGGGSSGSSGSSTVAGGSPIVPAPSCTPELNLLGGNLGPNNNWIGGDASSSVDNPCGVQGLIYAFGDKGLDNIPGTADDSCPHLDQRVSPCKDGRCCVSGETHLWPGSDYQAYHASVWGCGIGISLNDPKDGFGTLPYDGPAKKFRLVLSGTHNGHEVRVGYSQVATDSIIPFEEFLEVGTFSVGFLDVVCPNPNAIWPATCIEPGGHPQALQVWIMGGDTMGAFELCLEGVYPVL